MFKRDSSKAKETASQPAAAPTGAQKKGHRTPTRKEAEAANTRPLVAGDRKLAKEIDRQKRAEAIQKERIALQTGDERYLPFRDKGRVRRFTRNWVDARWSLSEFVLPMMLFFMVSTFGVGFILPQWGQKSPVMLITTIILYGFFFFSLVEGIWVWSTIRKKVALTYPNEPIGRGGWFYCWSRMIMARRWRSPRPQVARGEKPKVTDKLR